LSVVEGAKGVSWSLSDSVALGCKLRDLGVDVIDCSSSGVATGPGA